MELHARVNILGGRAVRLPHGDVADAIALDADPLARAQGWAEKGVDRLLVIDLDAAAYGAYDNRPLIDRIIDEAGVPVQVGGGVRTRAELARLIERGAWRVVVGTVAIEDQVMIWDLCREFPGKITVALDVQPDEEVVVRGWTIGSGMYLEEVLIDLSSAGVASFHVAQAGRNALEQPSNLGILRSALEIVDEPVIASGGARDEQDLRNLAALEAAGRTLGGVVVGREITEGRFTIERAREIISG
ncbi:MAG: HisA/HisF-related TIM barrel protein [Acidimicrobiia bacterium]|nr:HisA/HisF-related TIM barrel protein [Acidimicrobiia bacterium]